MIPAPTKTEPTSDQRSLTLTSSSSGSFTYPSIHPSIHSQPHRSHLTKPTGSHQIIIPHGGVDSSTYDEEFGKAIHQYAITQLALATTPGLDTKIEDTICTLVQDSDYRVTRTGEVTLNFNVGNYSGREWINKFNEVRRCECGKERCVCARQGQFEAA